MNEILLHCQRSRCSSACRPSYATPGIHAFSLNLDVQNAARDIWRRGIAAAGVPFVETTPRATDAFTEKVILLSPGVTAKTGGSWLSDGSVADAKQAFVKVIVQWRVRLS